MDDLIVRFLQGNASGAEVADLERWRAESEANEAHFRELSDLWELTGLAAPRVETTPPDVEEILRRAQDSEMVTRVRRGVLPVRRRVRRWVAAAAAIVLLAATAYGVDRLLRSPSVPDASFRAAEYQTGADERATARLPDGTIVKLAPSSRLQLVERQGTREVSLQGGAFFAVASNPDAPFVVRTRAGDAHVLGTRFDLRVTDETLRVVVVEGRVGVKVGTHEIDVDKGQMTLAAEHAEPAVVDVDDVHSLLDWMGQSLVFQTTTLKSAFQEIERLYGAEIEVRDQEILTKTITAWFTDQPFEEVMTVVCRVAQLKCTVGPSTAEIANKDLP